MFYTQVTIDSYLTVHYEPAIYFLLSRHVCMNIIYGNRYIGVLSMAIWLKSGSSRGDRAKELIFLTIPVSIPKLFPCSGSLYKCLYINMNIVTTIRMPLLFLSGIKFRLGKPIVEAAAPIT